MALTQQNMRHKLWSRNKKDFCITWFSGTGSGGQHRNRHMNCCRIKDKETGLMAESQEFKSAIQNKKAAFRKLVSLLEKHYASLNSPSCSRNETADFGQPRIRTYDEHSDRVTDDEFGNSYSYKHTVGKGDIGKIIEERLYNSLMSTKESSIDG